jgi:hypothetical protein
MLKFKKNVEYKAYELNSLGVRSSRLGLSYTTMGISNKGKNKLYDGILSPITGFTITNYISTTKDINNLNLYDIDFINRLNSSDYVGKIVYKREIIDKATNKSYPESPSKPIIKITPGIDAPKVRIHKIVTYYGDVLGDILNVVYDSISSKQSQIIKIKPISTDERTTLGISKDIRTTIGTIFNWTEKNK